jgi:superfamily II DNA or RNA helicase
MAFELRKWQQEALEKYRTANKADFLVTATPGAGKTQFALTVAEKLLAAKQIDTVVIIVPTDHLRTQWSDAAIERSIFLDPSLSNKNNLIPPDFNGYVATYAQVAMNPGIHLARVTHNGRKTLVIFDEIHHAGDGLSWGLGIEMAFRPAKRRLALTGTPFRTGDEIIPFVKYDRESDGSLISHTDYAYGYKEALADGVVRPVSFAAYSGETSWSNNAGQVLTAKLGDSDLSKANEQAAWRTALDPKGQWISHVIHAANERLTEVRKAGMKNAGAMILASDQDTAREYAKVIARVTGTKATVILSDDRGASKKIHAFSDSTHPEDRWLVAVRMVSEGVDVPRLAVGVWATNYRTDLFFAQAVGRFVRAKKKGEVATIFLPAVRPLLALAANLEEQRKHVIAPAEQSEDEDEHELIDPLIDEEESEKEDNPHEFTALSADANFAHILFNGKAYDGSLSEEELDYLGIPGLLSPTEMAQLLQQRDKDIKKLISATTPNPNAEISNPIKDAKEIKELKKEINRMVSRIALSKGIPHAQVHARAKKAIAGPPTATAPIEVLKSRIEWLEQM